MAAVVEGKMYVIGGEELEELGNDSALKHPECYDPVKAVWTSLPPMPGDPRPSADPNDRMAPMIAQPEPTCTPMTKQASLI